MAYELLSQSRKLNKWGFWINTWGLGNSSKKNLGRRLLETRDLLSYATTSQSSIQTPDK